MSNSMVLGNSPALSRALVLAALFLVGTVSLPAQENLFDLLEENASEQQLWGAAEELTVPEVETYLSDGGEPDVAHEFGGTALMFVSAYNSNPAVVEALLEAGADVNESDSNGLTALMVAAMANNNPQVLVTLIEAGAEIDATSNDGRTAADYAEQNPAIRDTEAFELLQEGSE